jgi:hypothetical protein
MLWLTQAMGMMLPTAARGDVASQMAGADPTLEGKMACMSIGSYADCARNTMQLDRTLDELKVRAAALLRCIATSQLLPRCSPAQGCHRTLHPRHPAACARLTAGQPAG